MTVLWPLNQVTVELVTRINRAVRHTVLFLLAVGLTGCGERLNTGDKEIVAVTDLAAHLELTKTVVLEQSDSMFIAGVSGIDVAPSGEMLVADPREGDVKWFDARGALIRVLGRKGDGPGEFRLPYFPRFMSDGSVVVGDIGRGTSLTTFSRDGQYIARIPVAGVQAVGHFEVLNDSTYLLSGRSSDSPASHVLFEVSEQGAVRRSHLPIADVHPTGLENEPLWDGMAVASFTVSEDTVFLVMSGADSLWTVDLRSGAVGSIWIGSPLLPPIAAVSDSVRKSSSALGQYFQEQYLAATPVAANGMLIVPFVRGVSLEGGDVISVIRTRRGWLVTQHAPLFERSMGVQLVALQGPVDSLSMRFYKVH